MTGPVCACVRGKGAEGTMFSVIGQDQQLSREGTECQLTAPKFFFVGRRATEAF